MDAKVSRGEKRRKKNNRTRVSQSGQCCPNVTRRLTTGKCSWFRKTPFSSSGRDHPLVHVAAIIIHAANVGARLAQRPPDAQQLGKVWPSSRSLRTTCSPCVCTCVCVCVHTVSPPGEWDCLLLLPLLHSSGKRTKTSSPSRARRTNTVRAHLRISMCEKTMARSPKRRRKNTRTHARHGFVCPLVVFRPDVFFFFFAPPARPKFFKV